MKKRTLLVLVVVAISTTASAAGDHPRYYSRTKIRIPANAGGAQFPAPPPAPIQAAADAVQEEPHQEFPDATMPASPPRTVDELEDDAWRIINAGRLMADGATRYARARGSLPPSPGHLVPTYVSAVPAISDIADIKGNSHGHPHGLSNPAFSIYRVDVRLCARINEVLGNGSVLHNPEDADGEGCDAGVYFKHHPGS